MKRLGEILNYPQYQEYYNAIAKAEKERIFCCHDIQHFVDVARTAYILYLTGEEECPELLIFSDAQIKELIYAVGFLHDIGRFLEYRNSETDHAVASEELSRPFLEEAGFSHVEQALILKAIRNHRNPNTTGFDKLIFRSDKESRLCFRCPSLKQCKKYSNGEMPKVII